MKTIVRLLVAAESVEHVLDSYDDAAVLVFRAFQQGYFEFKGPEGYASYVPVSAIRGVALSPASE
jgi:hypothetical protein